MYPSKYKSCVRYWMPRRVGYADGFLLIDHFQVINLSSLDVVVVVVVFVCGYKKLIALET